jgi:hypothetical protein
MFDEMAECCIKVYALEKVLKIKKNPNSMTPFLEDVVKELDNNPSALFWMSLGTALDKHFRDTAKSTFQLCVGEATLTTSFSFCVSPANFGGWILQALENVSPILQPNRCPYGHNIHRHAAKASRPVAFGCRETHIDSAQRQFWFFAL